MPMPMPVPPAACRQVTTMTWSLDSVDDGTLVTIAASIVPDGISNEDRTAAFASTLGSLNRYLDRDVV